MAEGPFTIGLNETQVGIAIPPGIMQLLQRTVGPRRAEAMLVPGEMVDSERALKIGFVDELADVDHVLTRALARLDLLLDLPRGPAAGAVCGKHATRARPGTLAQRRHPAAAARDGGPAREGLRPLVSRRWRPAVPDPRSSRSRIPCRAWRPAVPRAPWPAGGGRR